MREKPFTNWDAVPILFDIALACKIFDVKRDTIYRWIKNYGMPVIKIGASPRFEKATIIDWLNTKSA